MWFFLMPKPCLSGPQQASGAQGLPWTTIYPFPCMAQPGITLPFVIASLQMVSSDSFLFISSVLAVLGLCYLCTSFL